METSRTRSPVLQKLQSYRRPGEKSNTTRDHHCDETSLPKSSWQALGEADAPSRKYTGTQGSAAFWEPLGAHVLLKKTSLQLHQPKTVRPFSQAIGFAVS